MKINDLMESTASILVEKKISTPKKPLKIPEYLIWETLDGKPLYRRGYKDVLRKTKKTEDIMGSSGYQSTIIAYIVKLLNRNLQDNFEVYSSESGIHLAKNSNLAADIAIYEDLPAQAVTKKYMSVPPRIVIEVDIDIDPDSMHELEYVETKTQKMLDFGVQKVIWILTYVRKVIIATPNNPTWLMIDWSQDIEVLNGITFNIHNYLNERGIDPLSIE
jgi:Uma2 family endonuclease